MNWTPHVTVAAVIERQGRFLMVQERADGRTVLNQPAGHLEDGESLTAAVQREVLEETGWHFEPQVIVGVYRWRHPQRGVTFVRFTFAGGLLQQESAYRLDPDIEAVHWLSEADIRAQLDQLRSPMVMRCIEDYRSGSCWPLTLLSDVE